MSYITAQVRTAALVLVMTSIGLAVAYLYTGWPGLLILGCSAVPAFVVWFRTYLRAPTDPAIILPVFLLTVAGFQIHSVEEYLGHYGPAIGRLFDFGWTDQRFVMAILFLSSGLSLVAIALCYRVPVAGFIATFFIVTRFAEFLLFVFPFVRPATHPEIVRTISQPTSSGVYVANMPTYFHAATGHYYFPGMYTFPLVIIPAIYALYPLCVSKPQSAMEAK